MSGSNRKEKIMSMIITARRLFASLMVVGALSGCTRTIPLEKTSPQAETLTGILDRAKDRYGCFGYGISKVSEDLASSAARLDYIGKCGSGIASICEIHPVTLVETVAIACSSGQAQE